MVGLFPRRIPDRTRNRAFLRDHLNVLGQICIQPYEIVRCPARCGDLDHTHIIKRTFFWIKILILPVEIYKTLKN
jgi:hypothetical protein